MQLKRRPLAIGAACATIICAVAGIGVASNAQPPLQLPDTQQPAQPTDAPAAPRKPIVKLRKPPPPKVLERQSQAAKPQPKEAQAQPKAPPAPPAAAPAQPSGAAAQAAPAAAAPAPTTPAAPGQAASADVFAQQASQGGILTCAKVFDALGRGVAADAPFAARTQWDNKASDAHAVQSIIAFGGGAANPAERGAGVVFAAPIGRSCEGSLVRVTPMARDCITVAGELAKINGQSSNVGDLPLIALPNGAQVMLVPFGNACVAVSTLRATG